MKSIYLIDTAGQVTAVVTKLISIEEQAAYAALLMQNKQVEQVGFLDTSSPIPSFRMMGGELSINGTIAGLFVFNIINCLSKSIIYLNGPNVTICSNFVDYSYCSVDFTLDIVQQIDGCFVTFRGIKYQVITGIPSVKIITASMKNTLKLLTETQPAAGLIFSDKKCIQPLLYVKKTDTYTWESGCGSGSLAFSLVSGVRDVVQPSGKVITITKSSGKISISTEAKEVEYACLSNA